MIRLSVALALTLTAACGPKQFGSICDDPNAPTACATACDPAPGAANSCPPGFHCSEDGTCDAQCTPGGGQCGDGYTCSDDGRCVDDSGPGSNGPDANCPAVNFVPKPTTPSIGLVLDQSGSMYPPDSTRYSQMREALVGTTGIVSQLESKAYFGALLYTCGGQLGDGPLLAPETPRALNNAAGVRTLIDSKLNTRGGGTPTHAGVSKMVASFAANPPPAGSPPVIVLATDGIPNTCSDTGNGGESASVAAAAAAYAAGIPVYVLAINQNSQHFQDVANAGAGVTAGQPDATYYPVQNATQLKQAFDTIINGVISCDLALTSSIDAAQAMNGTVMVNGMPLMYGTDWILVNGDTIRLLGQACTNLKTTPNPMVSASFPCGAVIL
jgi:von Willebrand factor type A domain